MEHRDYMKRAVELALKGKGWTSPNPLVGAVIVKDGRIIGEGYHERYGDLHAERNALKNVTEDPAGAVMYVTLEPCCHHGKQPPCTDAVLEAGISEIYIGSRDPNPLVAGKGEQILRDAGVRVTRDFMKDECDSINYIFFKYITTGRPYVMLKYAMSMDGKTAAYTGDSKWITGEKAREEVHLLRHRYSAIMAGIGTVIADDPMLNTRIEGLRSPLRVIADSKLDISSESRILKTAGEYPTVIAACSEDGEKIQRIEAAGAEVLKCGYDRVDLGMLLDELGKRKIDSLMVEGGGELAWSFVKEDLVDEINVFIAPKVIGGRDAKSPVAGQGIAAMADAVEFRIADVERIDEDLRIRYVHRDS